MLFYAAPLFFYLRAPHRFPHLRSLSLTAFFLGARSSSPPPPPHRFPHLRSLTAFFLGARSFSPPPHRFPHLLTAFFLGARSFSPPPPHFCVLNRSSFGTTRCPCPRFMLFCAASLFFYLRAPHRFPHFRAAFPYCLFYTIAFFVT